MSEAYLNNFVKVLPSAQIIFAGIGVLLAVRSSVPFVHPLSAYILQATKDVRASHDALADLFERIQFFLKRLGVHTQIPPTKDMVEILVKIVAEVLTILSIATKELQQSRTSKLFLRDLVNCPLTTFVSLRNTSQETNRKDGY